MIRLIRVFRSIVTRHPRAVFALGLISLLGPLTGCPVTTPLPSSAPIQEMTLPREHSNYYLYVPSNYRKEHAYPLVIACHGTNPWDTAYAQISEWAQFAEQSGIIVAAPLLVGTRGDFRPLPADQFAKQREDERRILELVQTLKAGRNIAAHQVYMTGWSAGSFAMLYTGLRHPEIFRALAIRQGTFDERYMDAAFDRYDRWQPIYIYFGQADFLRDESVKMIRWLRDRNLYVEELEMPGSHRRIDVRQAWDFFRKIDRERPWIRLRSSRPTPTDRRVVRFEVDARPAAVRYKWDFGDGAQSTEATPTHTYEKPGRYEVKCDVRLKVGKTYRRTTVVQVGVSEGPES